MRQWILKRGEGYQEREDCIPTGEAAGMIKIGKMNMTKTRTTRTMKMKKMTGPIPVTEKKKTIMMKTRMRIMTKTKMKTRDAEAAGPVTMMTKTRIVADRAGITTGDPGDRKIRDRAEVVPGALRMTTTGGRAAVRTDPAMAVHAGDSPAWIGNRSGELLPGADVHPIREATVPGIQDADHPTGLEAAQAVQAAAAAGPATATPAVQDAVVMEEGVRAVQEAGLVNAC